MTDRFDPTGLGLGQRVNEIAHRRRLFEKKFTRRRDSECWPWNASKNQHGNGIFGMGPLWKGTKAAHVAAWFFYRDEDLDLDNSPTFYHLCSNPGCVNPRHLAQFGDRGLQNDREVLRFLIDRYPTAADPLSQAILIISEEPARLVD